MATIRQMQRAIKKAVAFKKKQLHNIGLKPITLIDNQDRSKLGEGRSQGFGGGFAKFDAEKNTLEMVMPLTACADFYSEVVHTEYTGREWKVYSFNHKKQDIFKNTEHAYLVCGILPYLHSKGEKYKGYDEDVKALEDNYKHIQSLINWFEDKLGIKNKTEVIKIADNRFVFKFDLFWTQGTYRISLYKFLQRAPIWYDGKQTPIEYFDSMKDAQTREVYAWKAIKPKLLDMLSGFIPEQKMTDKDTCPHHVGIQTFPWPRELKAEKA